MKDEYLRVVSGDYISSNFSVKPEKDIQVKWDTNEYEIECIDFIKGEIKLKIKGDD